MRFHTELKPNNYKKKSLCTETDQNEPFSLSKGGAALPQGNKPKLQSRISGDTLKKLHVHALRTSPGSVYVRGRLTLVPKYHRNLRRDSGTAPLTLFHSIYTIHHLQRSSCSGGCEAE